MGRGLPQMVSVIAPAVPELIKKQDHTPVQRGVQWGEGGKNAEPGSLPPPHPQSLTEIL